MKGPSFWEGARPEAVPSACAGRRHSPPDGNPHPSSDYSYSFVPGAATIWLRIAFRLGIDSWGLAGGRAVQP
jgi:hypothetical protein